MAGKKMKFSGDKEGFAGEMGAEKVDRISRKIIKNIQEKP